MFVSANLLLMGGLPFYDNYELISFNDPNSSKEIHIDKDEKRRGGVGAILRHDTIVYCGGTNSKMLVKDGLCVNNGQKFPMQSQRLFSAGLKLNDSTFWVTGGMAKNDRHSLMSTEFITLAGNKISSRKGPNLPTNFQTHCMIQMNSKSVLIIGGDIISNMTWIVDNPMNDFQINRGPSMIEARGKQCCGKFYIENKVVIVVAGGNYDPDELSCELLDTTSIDNGWIPGPCLPFQVLSATMSTSQDGKGVILCGGYNATEEAPSDLILELRGDSMKTLKWNVLPQKLKSPRHAHVSIPLSNAELEKILPQMDSQESNCASQKSNRVGRLLNWMKFGVSTSQR